MTGRDLQPAVAAPGPGERVGGRGGVGAVYGLLFGAGEALVGDEVIEERVGGRGGGEERVGEHDVAFAVPGWGGGECDVPLAEELVKRGGEGGWRGGGGGGVDGWTAKGDG